MQLLVSFAEGCGALCIVISDMSVPGAPMVYVNPPFCRCTGYAREEAVGRNCRFLQGPDTEFESLRVIRSTLAKAQLRWSERAACDDDSRVSWLWSRRSRESVVVGRGKEEIAARPPDDRGPT
jgi:PAS domain S-box-containing protein